MVVRLERMVCRGGKWSDVKICRVKFLSRNVATANFVGTLKKTATTMRFHFKTLFKFSNNEYRPMLVDSSVNFCQIQAGLYSSPLYTFLLNIMKNQTNLNCKCPIPPGEYYIKNVNFQAHHLPSIIPAGQYIANVTTFIEPDELIHNVLFYFAVVNYGVDQWKI